MRNVTYKFVEKIRTPILCSFFFLRNSAACVGENIIWCMRFSCWILKDTDTHSQYVTCIALSLQQ